MFVVLVLVSALALVACETNHPRRVGSGGVTVELPSGWHVATAADLAPGQVTDPLARVVVSSAAVTRHGVPCQIAEYAPPADGVSIVVVEWRRTNGRPPPRPARFTPHVLEIHSPPAIECFDGSGGTAQFAEHGRIFGAYVMLGRTADSTLADQALAVLDTLRVERASASRPAVRSSRPGGASP